MIFKVFYQENPDEVPVREKTKTIYIEAKSEREVRQKLRGRTMNIEYIQPLEGAHLEYEKKNPDFKVLEI
jgi:DNA-dependent RNA polymerase auxiliary subunit epsilon